MIQAAPKTLDGIVLLGWMDREEAVKYLQEQCLFDPQISEQEAERLWAQYRDAVESLPARTVVPPQGFRLSLSDQEAAKKFRAKVNSPSIVRVIRIDPLLLLVHQMYVVTERSDGYAPNITGKGWVKECLLAEPVAALMRIQGRPDGFTIDLPHPEFLFGPDNQGTFRVLQGGRFVSTAAFGTGMMLTAGYHRTFAHTRIAKNAPDATARSILVALTTVVPFWVSPAAPNQGLRAKLLGPRPPVFADFFNTDLFMPVKLRKKRYELQIAAKVAAIDV